MPLPELQFVLGQRFKKGVGEFELPLHGTVAAALGGRGVEYRRRRNRGEPYLTVVGRDNDLLPGKRALDEDG